MKILVICTGNSARSQMAEGFFKALGKDRIDAKSAGTHPSTVNPLAIRVMEEAGIDISSHTSKSFKQFWGETFDFVITVCDRAKEECPYFPGAKNYIHHGFEDPAAFSGTDEEKLLFFRNVRDAIMTWVEEFLRTDFSKKGSPISITLK